MSNLLVGIEIGGTKLQLVISDSVPLIKDRYRAQVDPEQGAKGILSRIEQGLKTLLGSRPASAVGIGFGGPVNWQTLRIGRSHQIEGWDGYPIGDWIRQQTAAPVALENDANVACFAEASCGAGEGFNPVAYTTLGSGVGGGLTVNGEIYHGAIPGETEIGHLRLDKSGRIVESSCAGWAVDRKVRDAAAAQPTGLLATILEQQSGPPAAALGPALAQGDPAAQAILSQTADDLAFGLSHVIHLQHPETIILGGGLSLLGEPLRSAVAEALPQYLMKALLPPPQIQLAGLGEDVVPIGALLLAARAQANA